VCNKISAPKFGREEYFTANPQKNQPAILITERLLVAKFYFGATIYLLDGLPLPRRAIPQ
jgi:hypothetical protein